MISFRYHIVTIVAVFVALGAGILLGGTVFDTALAKTLNEQVRAQRAKLDLAQGQVADLNAQLKPIQQLERIYLPRLLEDRLTGVPTVLVTVQDVDLSALRAASQSLTQAGVINLMTIQLQARLGSSDPTDQSALVQALGLSSATPPSELPAQAVVALAERLLHAPIPGALDVLTNLQTAGFIRIFGQASLDTIGLPGQTVAMVAGGSAGSLVIDPSAFLLPLIDNLVSRSPPVPVVAAEPSTTMYPFVSLIRTSDLSGKLVTVDDIEQVPGQLSLALGLQDLVQSPGHGANYGRGDGASAPFPAP